MKCKSIRMACTVAAALLLAACANDELAEQGTALPYGEYPLEISGVTLDVESGSEPWSAKTPQTRVTENTDGMSSTWEWDGTEKIGVKLYADGQVATYTLNEGQTLTHDKTLYWKDTKQAIVTAWYPVYEGESGTVDLTDQSKKLAYVLKGSGTGTYQDKVSLSFSHSLAKVRVKLNGSQTEKVTGVQIKSYTSCTNTQGSVSTNGANEGWITMKPCTYNGTKCWEANVVPSAITKFKVNDKEGTLSDFTPKAGRINTLTIDVAKEVNISDIKEDNYKVEGNVVLKGDDYEHTLKLTVSEGANLTLENVKLKGKTNQSVIEVKNASATITFSGENEITTDGGDGYDIIIFSPIHVSGNNATLTIDGKSNDNKLTLEAKGTYGVGLCATDGANLVINGGTIIATGGNSGAAIGGTANSKCGNITINNGDITATGGVSAAAIGAGPCESNGTASCGDIAIRGGKVTATGNPSETGWGSAGIGCGAMGSKCGNITISGGDITVNGGYYGAGIGSAGQSKSNGRGRCGIITISGGKITANGGFQGAAIGSGRESYCGDINISGGNIIAKGKENTSSGSTAIGGGYDGYCGSITISGGEVQAEAAVGTDGYGGTGIGTYSGTNKSSNLNITGGTVIAKGAGGANGSGAGLGAGPMGGWGNITISGSKTVVTATAGGNGSDNIGSGTPNSTCGTVTIKDGATVNDEKYTQAHTGYL